MSAKERSLKKGAVASSSIVAPMCQGVLVGIVVGCIVSSFVFDQTYFHLFKAFYGR